MIATVYLRRISGAASLSILAIATSASAECAWVLWNRSAMGQDIVDGRPWSLTAAYVSRSECWEKIWELTFVPRKGSVADTVSWLFGTGVYDPARHVHRKSNGVLLFLGEGENAQMMEYRCLPVIVDPREPKGR